MKKIISFILVMSLFTVVSFGPVTINAGEKGPLHIIVKSGGFLQK